MKRALSLKAGHSKAIFSVRDVVDDSGAVIRSMEFQEHGLEISSSGSGSFSPKTYQGGLSVNDDTNDSGLYLMGHRHFASDLGRFISRDPIGFRGGLNLYGTAFGNNPVTIVDPSGLKLLPFSGTAVFDGLRQVNVVGRCECPESATSARPTSATVGPPLNSPGLNQANFQIRGPRGVAKVSVDPVTGQTFILPPDTSGPEVQIPLYVFQKSITVSGCECVDSCGNVSEGKIQGIDATYGGAFPTPFYGDDRVLPS